MRTLTALAYFRCDTPTRVAVNGWLCAREIDPTEVVAIASDDDAGHTDVWLHETTADGARYVVPGRTYPVVTRRRVGGVLPVAVPCEDLLVPALATPR